MIFDKEANLNELVDIYICGCRILEVQTMTYEYYNTRLLSGLEILD